MRLLERHMPAIVSSLGSLGLGLTLTYFVGVFLAFQPGWETWAAFFVDWGPPAVVVPAGLLVAHLYLRMQLGEWLVDRGRIDDALDFTADRLDHDWRCSKREALHHRLARARAWVVHGDYDRASELLWSGYAIPPSGRMAARIRRWQAEIALRRGDPASVREAYRHADDLSGHPRPLAHLEAARAELASREETRSDFLDYAEGADWLEEGAPRVDWSWILGAAAFEEDDDELDWALTRLEAVRTPVVDEIPGRAPEIEAVRAELLAMAGRLEEARDALESARRLEGDDWSHGVVERVASNLEA
jgi:tetratricopeptide (TPR) repeat protein